MNSRIVTISEIDVIFYEELSLKQVTTTYRIINILTKYVFLSTDMLMTVYKQRYNEHLGLGALKKAVKERLIIEYKMISTRLRRSQFIIMHLKAVQWCI